MEARENERQISQNYILHVKCLEFYITILVKFDIYFLWLLWEIFFGVTTDDYFITSLVLEWCKKRTQYSLNYSGTRFLSTEN